MRAGRNYAIPIGERQLSNKLVSLSSAPLADIADAAKWLLDANSQQAWPRVLEPYQRFCPDKNTLLRLLLFFELEHSCDTSLLEHLAGGWKSGGSVAPWFDPAAYEVMCAQRQIPHEAAILHYAREGYAQGLSPDPLGTCALRNLKADLILHASSPSDLEPALAVFEKYRELRSETASAARWLLLDDTVGHEIALAFSDAFAPQVGRGEIELLCTDEGQTSASLARLIESEAWSERQIFIPLPKLEKRVQCDPLRSAPALLSERRKLLRDGVLSPRITIRCPAPNAERAHRWGDFHFAESLSDAFGRLGVSSQITFADDWDGPDPFNPDATILLRGVRRRRPDPEQVNLMWMLSHPDRIQLDELNRYDHVFVSSFLHAQKLATDLGNRVSPLLQCSDPTRFDPALVGQLAHDVQSHKLLFVGNSRNSERWVVSNAVKYGHPLSVYGAEWEGTIVEDHVVAENISNRALGQYYSKADIVLNDHWPDMAERGFVSNRIFDIGMSRGFAISDSFAGAGMFFGAIPLARDPDELDRMIRYFQDNVHEREARATALHRLVRNRHTFDNRAATILARVKGLF